MMISKRFILAPLVCLIPGLIVPACIAPEDTGDVIEDHEGVVSSASTNLPAFPCATGFGATATGGRGGDVYHVTKLSDNGSSGTLRHGLTSATGPRTIVFDVGGNIALKQKLKLPKDNVTIAGQTAPGGGITLSGYPFVIEGRKNIIVRYLRIRTGDFNAKGSGNGKNNLAGEAGDSLSIYRSDRIMIDHVTASWSMDENLGLNFSTNVTIQHSLFSEGLFNSYHRKGPHSRGTLVGGFAKGARYTQLKDGFSFYQNLFAHFNMRNPVVGGQKCPDPGQSRADLGGANLDFVNNVIYDWGERSGHTATNAIVHMNYINNYLIAGPSTKGGTPSKSSNLHTAMRVEKDKYKNLCKTKNTKWADDLNQFFIYYSGTYMDTDKDSNHNGHLVGDAAFINFEAFERLNARYAFPAMSYQTSAQDAYTTVLADAGASRSRDAIDARIVNEVQTRTGHIIDSQSEVGGLVPLAQGTAPLDSDGDGMPNAWETSHGLNPSSANDRNGIGLSPAGYTNLEVYLNSLTSCGAPTTTPPPPPPPPQGCNLPAGHPSYCKQCGPCDAGEGDCDKDSECALGLVCAKDVGANYGFSPGTDVCEAPATPQCNLPPGHSNYCRDCGPCDIGEGDCDGDGSVECKAGLVCAKDVGANYGFSPGTDVCEAPPTPQCNLPAGHRDYCRDCGPCDIGEGDCDGDGSVECKAGLVCAQNVGLNYGFSAGTDVCEVAATPQCNLPVGHKDYCAQCGPCGNGEGDCDSDSDCVAGTTCVHNVGATYGFSGGTDVCLSN